MDIDNVKRACSETLILALLSDGPLHGYDMAKEIERRSAGYFTFKHSTLYPILHRLQKRGLLEGQWSTPGPGERPRKVYQLTPAGQRYRVRTASAWREFFGVMSQLVPEVAS